MKDKKIIFGIILAFIFLASVGFSYAYFSNSIVQNEVKDQIVETGTLQLTYTDGPEINMQNIKPGTTVTKTITVKNTGTLATSYNLIWQELNNEITHNEMIISATCERFNSNNEVEGTCEELNSKAIIAKNIKKNISIESGITHEYLITITFKDTNTSQNYNQGKTFNGVLGIEEYKDNSPEPIYCTFDGDMVQGAEYVNGQYTYSYKKGWTQTGAFDYGWVAFSDDIDGWGVTLTDKSSTDPVTSKLCTYINDKPIVVMDYMFVKSQAESIDLSSFNTSNVTSMLRMFSYTNAETLNLSTFNTSKITDMSYMFSYNNAKSIDLSSFDTSKVTNMRGMFFSSKVTTLNLSNFDTSSVINMSEMTSSSKLASIDVSSFDTSNVTDMHNMFADNSLTSIDVSNFDTSKVTDMYGMFWGNNITTIKGLTNFNTSNVTNMEAMFFEVKINTLDLNSFDTSNVTNMNSMFKNAVNLKTINVGNKFITNNVTSFDGMFTGCTSLVGSAGTTYDVNHVDKEYARIDGGTSSPRYFTLKQ